jgi:ornithine carbamoyltransferase
VLADLQTIRQHKGGWPGSPGLRRGRRNNMAHSYLLAAALAGLHVRIGPRGFQPDPAVSSRAQRWPSDRRQRDCSMPLGARR